MLTSGLVSVWNVVVSTLVILGQLRVMTWLSRPRVLIDVTDTVISAEYYSCPTG